MLSVHDEKVHFSTHKHLLRLILAQISPAYDPTVLTEQGLVKIKEPDRQAEKILKVIEYTLSKEADFLLLPELTAPFHHLETFESTLREAKGDLVANICYEHTYLEELIPILSEEELTRHGLVSPEERPKLVNFCRIAVKAGSHFRVFTQIKLSPFSGEFSLSARDTLFCGKVVYRFLTNWGNFLVLICKDYVGEVRRESRRTPMFDFLKSLTDQGLHWVFVAALNTEQDAFIHAARAFYYLQERSNHTFTLFLNTAELDNTTVVFPTRPHPKIRTTRDVEISPLFEGKPGWGTRLRFPGCTERLIGGTFVRLDQYQPMPTKEIFSPVFQTEAMGLSDLGIADELLATTESLTEAKAMPRILHNLPPQSTSFVGREEELAEIAELLRSSSCSLLTLLGPGGIGKTRLALQAAAETMSEFSHGVYFIPLAALSSGSFLASAIAESLGFSFHGPEDPKRQLLNYLREKAILLVLDNFEHLLDGGELLTEILQTASSTKMLVTSRERLNLKGEVVVQVQGMDVPASDEVDDVDNYSAVLLFVQSAERVRAGFSLSAEDRGHVIRICHMVEGVPLGIELASSWLRALSCKDVAKEVEDNLDFLASSARNVPERHRSMRAVFEYSWDLLSEDERRGFMKMSVFRGGFRRDAAQRVTGASLLLLSALVDKSLVRWNPSERYEIHELLRQYAEDKLSEFPQERQLVQELHCTHFLKLLHQDGTSVRAKGQEGVLEKIRAEIENIRRAWSWAIENCKDDLIGTSLENLFHFYILQSWFKEGEGLFGSAVEKLSETVGASNAAGARRRQILGMLVARHGVFWAALSGYDRARELLERSLGLLSGYDLETERAFCLRNLGLVLSRLGDLERAGELLREGLGICRRIEDSDGTAATLNTMGHCSYSLGDYEEAKRLYAESLSIYREIGNRQGVAKSLLNLGNVAQDIGEYKEAKALYEESLLMSREMGDESGTASSLNNLGLVAYQLGEYEKARQLYETSLALKREIGDRRGITMSLGNLGNVAQKLGQYPEAERFYQEMLSVSKEIGSKRGASAALTCMGHATSALRQSRRAEKYFHDALEIAMEINAIPMALDALAGIAALLAETHEKKKALQLLALVSADHRAWQDTKDRVSRLLTDLASQLPPKLASDAQETGRKAELADVANGLLKHRNTKKQ